MGYLHLKSAIEAGAEISAICDINRELLAERGNELNIPENKRYTDWKELLKLKEMNAVVIAAPDHLHCEMIEAFLKAGKHILCEKPLALTRDELLRIVKMSEKYNTKLMVGQISRFTPAFVKAKELVDEGAIGEIFYVESEYAHDYEKMYLENENHWRCAHERNGVIGGGCHAVDLLRWFAGDPTEVFSYSTHKMLPMVSYADTTISVLKFPNDVCGKVFVSIGCKRPYTMRTLIYGTKGTIICDNKSETMELYRVKDGEISVDNTPEIIKVDIASHNSNDEFREFARVINDNPSEYMDALHGAKTAEVCLAITESSERGIPIKPNYNF